MTYVKLGHYIFDHRSHCRSGRVNWRGGYSDQHCLGAVCGVSHYFCIEFYYREKTSGIDSRPVGMQTADSWTGKKMSATYGEGVCDERWYLVMLVRP